MISLMARLLIKLAHILPPSPFTSMLEGFEVLEDIMGYINWFIPFKPCFIAMGIWCGCMVYYYIYKQAKGIFSKIV